LAEAINKLAGNPYGDPDLLAAACAGFFGWHGLQPERSKLNLSFQNGAAGMTRPIC